ncbi:MAG TPA: choice-of-anchor L domain-containing protein, partial [Gemmataceae bacterium]|nr:choice-of-anchor L domain-containing protein [Gemmataceae bacterium]
PSSLDITPFTPGPTASVSTLTDALLVPGGGGLTVVSSSYVGADGQGGTYTGFHFDDGTTQLALPDGIVLTSGLARNALGPNDSPGKSAFTGTGTDPDLNGIVHATTYDRNVLTITFTADPAIKSVLFDFVFGSEEFPEFVGAFNDAFGAFLDGVQISFDSNGQPVTVNNNDFKLNNAAGVNNSTRPYGNYPPYTDGKTPVAFDIQYDGLTNRLTTQAALDASRATHTLKLVVADAGDAALDSGAFLARLRGSPLVTGEPQTGAPPTFAPVDPLSFKVGDAVDVQLSVQSPGGKPLTGSAVGLPDGVSLDAQHFKLVGTITRALPPGEAFQTAVVSFSDGTFTVSQPVVFEITDPRAPTVRDLKSVSGGAGEQLAAGVEDNAASAVYVVPPSATGSVVLTVASLDGGANLPPLKAVQPDTAQLLDVKLSSTAPGQAPGGFISISVKAAFAKSVNDIAVGVFLNGHWSPIPDPANPDLNYDPQPTFDPKTQTFTFLVPAKIAFGTVFSIGLINLQTTTFSVSPPLASTTVAASPTNVTFSTDVQVSLALSSGQGRPDGGAAAAAAAASQAAAPLSGGSGVGPVPGPGSKSGTGTDKDTPGDQAATRPGKGSAVALPVTDEDIFWLWLQEQQTGVVPNVVPVVPGAGQPDGKPRPPDQKAPEEPKPPGGNSRLGPVEKFFAGLEAEGHEAPALAEGPAAWEEEAAGDRLGGDHSLDARGAVAAVLLGLTLRPPRRRRGRRAKS